MKLLTAADAAGLLARQGVVSESEIEKILSGFDLGKPLTAMDFWPEDVLYQFIRLPSSGDPLPYTGNWFGLAGITMGGVSINSGLAGRRLASFKVVAPFVALEGTAVALPQNLGNGIGGPGGGGTQIFVPRALLGCLQSVGPAEPW
jgi:hypothetical protein